MATRNNVALVFLVLTAAVAVLHEAEGASHVVGNSTGWTVPTGGASFYSSWASGLTFSVGDTLVFNFQTGVHDVATVSKAAFDSCDTGNYLSVQATGPATIPLNATGENYFICTFGQHCSSGQKLSINVKAANSSSPSPSSSPPPPATTTSPPPPATTTSPPPPPTTSAPPPTTTSPPPPGSSASSLAATFSVVLMTIALTMFNLS